jgi:hypothetical protein
MASQECAVLCSNAAHSTRARGINPNTKLVYIFGCARDALSCSTVKGALSVMEHANSR